MVRVGVRAGILGAIGALFVSLFSLVPLVGNCLLWLFNVLLWMVVAAIVARGNRSPNSESDIALAGAVAGFLTGIVGGLVGILLAPVGLLLLGGPDGVLRLLPPELLQFYSSMGISPQVLFSPVGVLLTMSFTCGFQALFAPAAVALTSVLLHRWWGYDEADIWEDNAGPFMLEW